ncbi:hypothetical protein FRC00_004757 [Tulasnella sp. 408]|nr:hypothetical protein FRC00_004757 [Tulasnella sp. 408]
MDLDATDAENAPISTHDKEMLIRSTSTLLSLVHPNAGEPKQRSPEQDIAQFLDRFSIIFVSGRRHADIVATVPIFDSDKKLQVVAMTQEEPRKHEEEQGSNEQITQLAQELQEDEISFFIRRHDAKPSLDQLNRLNQYVYLYCVPKIKKRFDMELSGGRGKFINFFIGADGISNRVTGETYAEFKPVEPPYRFPDFKPKWSDEAWLKVTAEYYGGKLGLDPADPASIEQTTKAGYNLYICICIHFRMLHRGLSAVSPYINPSPNPRLASATNRQAIINALSDIATALNFLHLAVSCSRAFWRTIYTMGPHFDKQVTDWLFILLRAKQAEHVASKSLSSSGEQTNSGGFLTESGTGERGVETEDDEENGQERNVDGTRDDSDDRLRLVPKIRQWLILLTQWYHALADLEKYLPYLCNNLTAPLEIRARHVDQAPDPRKQAGLFETLAFIDPNIDLEIKITAIKAAVSNKTTTNSRALKVLQDLKKNSPEDPKEWAEAFAGGIHCEAQLYLDLKDIGIPYAVIGVSRQCCFCCNRLLEEGRLSPATHGRAYSWASPNGLDENSKQTILDDLKKHLQRFFSDARARSRNPESAPETELSKPIRPPIPLNTKPSKEDKQRLVIIEEGPRNQQFESVILDLGDHRAREWALEAHFDILSHFRSLQKACIAAENKAYNIDLVIIPTNLYLSAKATGGELRLDSQLRVRPAGGSDWDMGREIHSGGLGHELLSIS